MKPIARLDIVCIEDTLGTLALRPALEWWGVQVTLHLIGQALDVVDVLGGSTPLADTILVMCHGNEDGLVLPELGAEYEARQPYHGALTPANLAEFLRLPPGCTVISSGCTTGREAYAQAFFQGGCHHYIGPDDYQNGNSSLMYLLDLCYEWLCRKSTLRAAHERAAARDEETRMMRLYTNPALE